jgi:hypothetical protein
MKGQSDKRFALKFAVFLMFHQMPLREFPFVFFIHKQHIPKGSFWILLSYSQIPFVSILGQVLDEY